MGKKLSFPTLQSPETIDSFIDDRAFFHGDLSKPGLQVIFSTGSNVTSWLDVRTARGESGHATMINAGLNLPTLEVGGFNGFDELLFNNLGTLSSDMQMPGSGMSFFLVMRDIAGSIANPDNGNFLIRGNSFLWQIRTGNNQVLSGFDNMNHPGRVDGVYSFTVPSAFNVSGPVRIRRDGDLSVTGSSNWATTSLQALILGSVNVKIRIGELIAIADLDVEDTFIHQFITNHLVKKWFS